MKQLSAQPAIKKYENILNGASSSVIGNKNIIIGNNANVIGDSNYVFSDTYTNKESKPIENSLIINKWLVRMNLLKEQEYFQKKTAYEKYIYKH